MISWYNSLQTDVYVKPTNHNKLLLYSINHPRRMIDSLQWSQFLRVRRIVSQETVVDNRLDNMCKKFLKRGYPTRIVDSFKIRAQDIDRRKHLCSSNRQKSLKRIPFVSTFSPESGKIANIIRKHWDLLQRGCPTIDEFKQPPCYHIEDLPV